MIYRIMTIGGEMKYDDITEIIIGCAFKVYNELGFGFLESVYEKALLIELRKQDLKAVSQQAIKITYKDNVVGNFYADILVEGCVILELKSVTQLIKEHEIQLVNYLKATGKEVGLLINFGEKQVHIKRKVRSLSSYRDEKKTNNKTSK